MGGGWGKEFAATLNPSSMQSPAARLRVVVVFSFSPELLVLFRVDRVPDAGSYCTNPGAILACAVTQFCPAGSTLPSQCQAGFYCPTPNASIPCPAGSQCGVGVATPTGCPGGYSSAPQSSTCSRCPAGTFVNFEGTACVACPPGDFSGPGATSCFTCPAGTMEVNNTACVKCPAGSFSDVLGFSGTSCTSCPSGTYSPDQGRVSCTSCSLLQVCVVGRCWGGGGMVCGCVVGRCVCASPLFFPPLPLSLTNRVR